jgi:hypothetical protein
MSTMIEQAGLMLADPVAYTDEPRLHKALALLRREAPVHLVRAPGYLPFYAVTRHADITQVERDSALWLSEPRPVLSRNESGRRESGYAVRTLVNMDELAGQPGWTATTFVGGIKHLPIRYKLRARTETTTRSD